MFVNDFLSESDFKELENLFDNPQFSWYKQKESLTTKETPCLVAMEFI